MTATRIYSEAAERVIRSEAEIWRYGDVESARRSYDQLVTWARQLTREQRELHKWGAWHANDLLKMAAIGEVQREAGERFAIRQATHGHQWTYSNITAAEAQRIAGQLSAGSGEQWTVHPLAQDARS